MHNLLRLDYYENMDDKFEEISVEGIKILNATYKACTKFRKRFYSNGYKFNFPKEAMDGCPCNNTKREKSS